MKHLGDYDASTIIYGKFTTFRPSTGAPFTLAGTPALSVYKDNSTTQSTTGVTLTVDFDAVTGLHHFAIDTSADGAFYSAGSFFDIVITTGTVDSVSVVGTVVAGFTIRRNSCLKPTTSGRTLDVTATGEAGIDWANIGSPTTTVNLSGTTVKTATDVEADTVDIQSRLPAALVSGRIDASVGAMAASVLTATAIAADAITAAKIADGAIDALTFATGAITAAAIAADAITDAKVAADVTIASVTGSVGSVTGNVGGNVVGSVASVTGGVTVTTNNDKTGYRLSATGVDDVWDEAISGHLTAGSTGNALNSAGSAGDPWSTMLPGSYGAGTAGKIIGDNINATISSRSSHAAADVWSVGTRILTAGTNIALAKGVGVTGFTDIDAAGVRSAVGLASANLDTQLTAIDDFLDTEIAAIKAKTDNLPASPAATGDIPTAGAVADAVWDEALSGHLTAGSTGAGLNSAGSAGDPWSTALPGAYGAGTAGKIIGDNLNATISSRSTYAGGDTAGTTTLLARLTATRAGYLDNLSGGAVALASSILDAAGLRAALGLSSANLDTQLSTIDTVVDAVKVKTDSLSFTVSGQVDANIQYVNDVQVTGTGAAGDEWGP